MGALITAIPEEYVTESTKSSSSKTAADLLSHSTVTIRYSGGSFAKLRSSNSLRADLYESPNWITCAK